MPKIDQYIVDRIIERAKIVDVVGDFVQLKRKGARYEGLCPLHDDRHVGNFSVHPPSNSFKCFACGKSGDPVKFLMLKENLSFPDAIRWLGKKYGIETDMTDYNYTPPAPLPPPPPLPTLVLPTKFVNARRDLSDDNLAKWLHALPWDGAAAARIDAVLDAYRVGHSKQGHTIFWQIDDDYKVRTGKMMKYRTDGHRDKESAYNFDWVHSALSRKKNDDDPWPYPDIYNPDKQEMRTCFFGQHLLKIFQKANINIVESEKTAVIMSIAYGYPDGQIWLASGGKSMLNEEKMEPLIKTGRYITLFPDRDAIGEWGYKADLISYKKLHTNTDMVTQHWMPEDGEKADIADIIIRWVMEGKGSPNHTFADMKQKSQALRLLDEKLGLAETTIN